jgi:hypothetical protein
MVVVTLGGLLVGAVLGTRFRVLIVIPAAILGVIVITLVSAIESIAIASVVDAAIVYTISLQVGYLGGLFTRFLMVATRAAIYRSSRSHIART